MQKTRSHFFNYIKEVRSIITPLGINDSTLDRLWSQIENTELIVPVVGGFSAGKSTLINSFLHSDILPTAVTPETALATELRYGSTDYIEAIGRSDAVERYEIADFPKLKDNAQNFKSLRLYLNNEYLYELQPLVLVDMPGFDAPIENHNQAILTYLERGVYFVFLSTVEDGNITLSMKREIENLQRIGKGFAFCISKTNLRSPDDVQAVKNKIAEQLEDNFDYTGEIALLDMDGGNNLDRILKAIDPDALFHSLFIEPLRDNYLVLTESINLKISTFKSSKKEADEAVADLQNSIDRLAAEKENALAQVEHRYANHNVSAIAEKVSRSLLQRKEQLVELALHNQTAFSLEVNDLVKNSLLSEVQRSFQNIGSSILQDFGSHLKIGLIQNNLLIDESMIDRMQSGTEKLFQYTVAGLGSLSAMMKEKAEDKEAKNIYRALATVIGLTTNVVAPVLEIVLVFLPDIIGYFAKSAQERKVREQAEQQIVGKIIPDISAQIRQTLPETFNAQIRTLIEQISEQFEQQLQQKRDEIRAAEAEKNTKAAELENLIAELENGKWQLDELANRYLFA